VCLCGRCALTFTPRLDGLVLPAWPWRLRRSAARLLASYLVAPAGSIGLWIPPAGANRKQAPQAWDPGVLQIIGSFETIIVTPIQVD
jgi:hypothetical protein